jgi:hypothetical protein
MQEDIQGILSEREVESHHTQKVGTGVPFGVSARTLVKKQKEQDRVNWPKRSYSLCRYARARDYFHDSYGDRTLSASQRNEIATRAPILSLMFILTVQ